MLLRLNKSKWVRNIYKPIVEVSKKTLHAPLHNVQYSTLNYLLIGALLLMGGGAANSRFKIVSKMRGDVLIGGGVANLLFDPLYKK